ncbi:MinD/ParA family ATP-binding protein [Microbacterium radiodurans]|uniref:MinD/ParA family protein n=1 Tax=Microbacterium radiodurans TaxID=661398 RepID=A0A5J5IT39_9MICO|nr:MinD/ParA family protein [Microbacterium radiodurans]KAA9087191.1 MinD/ParA family protein [Microbacterium radiodurans]
MSEHNENQNVENDPAVLADSESIHTTAIGIVGGTAQVDVTLPGSRDDDLDDDDVIDGEVVDIDRADESAHDDLETGDIPLGIDARENDDAHFGADASTDADDARSDLSETATADDAGEAQQEGADDDGADDDAVAADDTRDADVPLADADVAHAEQGAAVDDVPDAAASAAADDVIPATIDEPATPVTSPVAAAPAASSAVEPVVATVVPTAAVITGGVPTTRREAHQAAEQVRHATERVQVVRPEPVLQSRRIGDLEPGRESADLLTAERLLDPAQIVRAEPEGRWQRFVYTVSARRINLGDGKRAKARKELDRRISAPLAGGAKFVPVLSRKGGVGKTTITTLLGMALADARDDRVIAIDANPDRGTLADRIGRTSGKTVRDLVRTSASVVGFNDLSSIVARDETRLDVLASDSDPNVSEAFSDHDYENVAAIAAHYYSIVLTDTGTGIVHSVMGATLGLSDQIVVVAGMSVDEARLASETLTWLESNGFAEAVGRAVVVLNTSRPGTPMVRADELEKHFSSRVRTVVRVPYDPHLAAGSAVTFSDLEPATREAARRLAAGVVEGLRLTASAA